jgi:hypothetical protein
LKPKCDELVSKTAVNANFRHHTVVNEANAHLVVEAGLVERIYNLMSEKKVRRCSLTPG